jgi:hypothetical protein
MNKPLTLKAATPESEYTALGRQDQDWRLRDTAGLAVVRFLMWLTDLL